MRSLSKSKWMEAVQSYVLYFFFYSMLGWLYEVFLEVVVYRWGFTNRGVLLGPYCPVYGVGALVFLLAFSRLMAKREPAWFRWVKPVLVFLGCMIAATAIERTAVAPVDDFAAQFHVDVDIGHNDRHVVAFPAFELCRREGFAAALSVTGRYRNRQGGLLRHKDGTVGGIGRHFERLDVGSSSPALGRGGGHREIDHGRRDESADRNPRNRGVGIVGKDDRQLRHHMVKEHPDRCRRWGNLFFHRDQQVRRCGSRGLIQRNGKLRGHSLPGVRMVGRERRFFIRIVIPQQIRGRKGRTVVGHQDILHVGFRTFGNAQPDAVAGIEMQSRNTGLDRRRDFHTRRTCVRL